MQTEIVIAGFGGQGVLFAGQLLSYAAMDSGKEVTWIPSYGPEMRGGTANCTVIISDEEIGSPNVRMPAAALAMNMPSFDKYESSLKTGGILVVNASLVTRQPVRPDIRVVMVPASEIAETLGNKRMTNMVMLGALLANLDVMPLSVLEKAVKDHSPARLQRMIPINLQAIEKGAEYIVEPVK
jgi:2-oxoglutarate ferredoxin oxidoreductase subunit gamma